MALALRDEESDFQTTSVQRTSEQERARIERARAKRREGVGPLTQKPGVRPVLPPTGERMAPQQRIQMLRMQRQEVKSVPEDSTKSATQYLGYMIAFAIAFCKDLLDFALIGSFPVIGLLVSAMASAFIAATLSFTDSDTNLETSRFWMRRILTLLGVTLVEGIVFGLNFFPLETAAVALLFFLETKGGGIKKVKKIIQYTPAGRVSKGVIK